MREVWTRSHGVQIVRFSILPRHMAESYLITIDGQAAGYAGVWTVHFPGRIMEFHLDPQWTDLTESVIREVARVSGATHIEAQSNMPRQFEAARLAAERLEVENLLFEDGPETGLSVAEGTFRKRTTSDIGPDGEWVLATGNMVLAAGGILTHYNPPYGDLYMGVAETHTGKGLGSFVVQELRRVCREKGLIPAARCNVDHEASKRTLIRGGMRLCGELVAGSLTI